MVKRLLEPINTRRTKVQKIRKGEPGANAETNPPVNPNGLFGRHVITSTDTNLYEVGDC